MVENVRSIEITKKIIIITHKNSPPRDKLLQHVSIFFSFLDFHVYRGCNCFSPPRVTFAGLPHARH